MDVTKYYDLFMVIEIETLILKKIANSIGLPLFYPRWYFISFKAFVDCPNRLFGYKFVRITSTIEFKNGR